MKNYWKLFLSVFTVSGILLGIIKEFCGAIRSGIKNIIREDEREKKRAKQEEEYKKQREARQREWEKQREQKQREWEKQREQRQREWEEKQEKIDQERIQRKIEEQEKFLENEKVEFKEINGIMHFKNQKGHWVPCSINTVKNKKKK